MRKKKIQTNGFTLTTLLIIVSVITAITVIVIPIITMQLEKSRETTDLANIRSAYAQLAAGYLENRLADSIAVQSKQKQAGWQTANGADVTVIRSDTPGYEMIRVPAATNNYVVVINVNGKVTVAADTAIPHTVIGKR